MGTKGEDDGSEEKLSGAELEFDTAADGTYDPKPAVASVGAPGPPGYGDGPDRCPRRPPWHRWHHARPPARPTRGH